MPSGIKPAIGNYTSVIFNLACILSSYGLGLCSKISLPCRQTNKIPRLRYLDYVASPRRELHLNTVQCIPSPACPKLSILASPKVPSTMEISQNPPTSSDSQPRKRKGRNSDIRKEQNRIASRAYRMFYLTYSRGILCVAWLVDSLANIVSRRKTETKARAAR